MLSQSYQALLEGMGIRWTKHEWTKEYKLEAPGSRACGAASSSETAAPKDVTGHVTEVMPDIAQWDALGLVWGRAGHYPLWVFLGYGRHHSPEGQQQRDIAKEKKNRWHNNGKKSWPWWRQHESEKGYWLPGGPDTGRGYSGHQCENRIVPQRSCEPVALAREFLLFSGRRATTGSDCKTS